MNLVTTIQQSEAEKKAQTSRDLLLPLIQPTQYVGDVYSISYESANVQIHDFYREKVGGIPSLCFLVASRIAPDITAVDFKREESSIILLRVMDSAPLP